MGFRHFWQKKIGSNLYTARLLLGLEQLFDILGNSRDFLEFGVEPLSYLGLTLFSYCFLSKSR